MQLADSIADYKKTIQEYEVRLKGLGPHREDQDILRSGLNNSRVSGPQRRRGSTFNAARDVELERKDAPRDTEKGKFSRGVNATSGQSGGSLLAGINRSSDMDHCAGIFGYIDNQLIPALGRAHDRGDIGLISRVRDRLVEVFNRIETGPIFSTSSNHTPMFLESTVAADIAQDNILDINKNQKACIDRLNEDNSRLNSTVLALESELKEYETCIHELNLELSQKSQAFTDASAQVKDLTEKLTSGEELINTSNIRARELNDSLKTERESLKNLKEELSNLKIEISGEKVKLNAARECAQRDKENIETISKDLIMTKSQNKVLEKLVSTQEGRLKQLTLQINQLTGDNSKLQKLMLDEDIKSKESNDYAESLKLALHKVKEELAIANAKIENLEYDMNNEKSENNRLLELLKEKETYATSLKEQNGFLNIAVNKRDSQQSSAPLTERKRSTSKSIIDITDSYPEQAHSENKEDPQSVYHVLSSPADIISIRDQLSEHQSKVQELSSLLKEYSSEIDDKEALVQILQSKVKSVEDELSIAKSNNIESSLSLKEALLRAEDDRRHELDAISSIRRILPEFAHVQTLQEFTHLARKHIMKKLLDDITGDSLHGEWDSKATRKSDIVMPSYRSPFSQKAERRFSEIPTLDQRTNMSAPYVGDHCVNLANNYWGSSQ